MASLIDKARAFAMYAHRHQQRKYTGTPYFWHVHAVAIMVFDITGDEEATAAAYLHDVLAECGARLILEALEDAEAGALNPQPQPEDGVTYAKKIEPADARIHWDEDAAAIERKVRAFAPRPGAWFEIGGARVKLLGAGVVSGVGEPGTVLDDQLTVACGEGAVRLREVQRAGKTPVSAEAFLRGVAIEPGALFD